MGLMLWLGAAPVRMAHGQLLVEDWGFRTIREYSTSGAVLNPNVVTLSSHLSSVVIMVPEPSSLALAMFAGLTLGCRRVGRRMLH